MMGPGLELRRGVGHSTPCRSSARSPRSRSRRSIDKALIYAGTDDGHHSGHGGRRPDLASHRPSSREFPTFFFVNDIKADLFDVDTAYACVDQHKTGDFKPYVFQTTDRGRTWTSISSNLPKRQIVWRLVQDHVSPDLLFVGAEMGVFFSVDRGQRWVELTGGVPNIPFRDLAIQRRENDLVCATFGRSFYVLDDYTPLRQVTEASLEAEATLFPVRRAWWYVQERTLGSSKKAFQGDAFYVAPNPPFGAVFTYYLKDEIRTRKAARREREKLVEEKGGDTPYPGWDELREEELEQEPAILLIVRDASGNVVRRIEGPAKAGFHRVAWDLRYPADAAIVLKEKEEESEGGDDEPAGFLVEPGSYRVSLAKRVDGKVIDLGQAQAFEVVPLRRTTLSGAPLGEVTAFKREVAALDRAVSGARAKLKETKARLEGIRKALRRSTVGDPAIDEAVRDLGLRLGALELALVGDERRGRMNADGPVSIQRRLSVAYMGVRWSTYGATPTHRESLAIAKTAFAGFQAAMDQLVRVDLPNFEQQLQAAGVPWSPGR